MLRLQTILLTLFLLMAAWPEHGLAQSYSNEPTSDPRIRRANREKAVAKIGPEAREFVETYGEDAVAVINVCSEAVVRLLIEFHRSGDMARLPRPPELLRIIVKPRHGDEVALWAMRHVGELTDPDAFDAYLSNALEYALELKSLKAGAEEVRANRPNAPEASRSRNKEWQSLHESKEPGWSLQSVPEKTRQAIAAGVVVIGSIYIIRWRRRYMARDSPA